MKRSLFIGAIMRGSVTSITVALNACGQAKPIISIIPHLTLNGIKQESPTDIPWSFA